MPTNVWVETINVRDVFHNDDMTFEEIRDTIARRLRASTWIRDRDQDGFDELGEIVDNIADAATVSEFDGWWAELYDHADRDRIWIATF